MNGLNDQIGGAGKFLTHAQKLVPTFKYIIAVVGTVAAAAIALGFFRGDTRLALLSTCVVVVLGALLIVFAGGSSKKKSLSWAHIILLYFSLLIFVGWLSLLFSSIFFGEPLDLTHWIVGKVEALPPQEQNKSETLTPEERIKVQGEVVDALTQKPIRDAVVTVEGHDFHVFTDSSGKYKGYLYDLPKEILLRIHVQHPEYRGAFLSLEVGSPMLSNSRILLDK